ncbi:MAG TPA: acetyl-CoA hydrolase/transferase family protein [Massilibacterium sp.]|nr:acetyl-CoA hydrolase/transferase family protein [Massilibacterium sp.]
MSADLVNKRIRNEALRSKIVDVKEAASWIEDGMTLGISGFTSSGDAKAVPLALVDRANNGEKFKVNLYTGASIGRNIDALMSEAGILNKRLPFQSDPRLRKQINKASLYYMDLHLSVIGEQIRSGALPPVDVAIIEAVAITEEGNIIPTTSGSLSNVYCDSAKEIIVELNVTQPEALEGIHDFYTPEEQGKRKPIPLEKPSDRIGTPYIKVDPSKIRGIVISEITDSPSIIVPPDEETQRMADYLIEFFQKEVEAGRLPNSLMPMQSGVGSVANAVLHGFIKSDFENLEVYSEVLQDSVFDLIDAGKVSFASGCALTLSEEKMKVVNEKFEEYAKKIVLRPQEISNNPELIRRMGLICINTALEVDIYGNVNSTHVLGRNMMNGIGGSGDFARAGRLVIFVTKSYAKGGDISSVVPFVSHVDHTEHDVDVIVTEQGIADLRGLAPRERAKVIIENCAHPTYRPLLQEYYDEAAKKGGQTPHLLDKAFEMHRRFEETGSMK